jgi:hypothetical protein
MPSIAKRVTDGSVCPKNSVAHPKRSDLARPIRESAVVESD